MLKFTADGKKGRIFFFGLSRGNLDRLTSDQPILINLAEMGGPEIQIAIVFGETEKMLFNDLKKRGLIPPEIEFVEAKVGTSEVFRIKRTDHETG